MKILLLAILCLSLGTAVQASDKLYPETVIPGSSLSIVGRDDVAPVPNAPITFKHLLTLYSTNNGAAVVRFWSKNPAIAIATVEGLQNLEVAAKKANAPSARIYARAVEKLTQQLQTKEVQPVAQAAVADALKAIDAK